MAINNGNTDFGLRVSKTGIKSLRISWSKRGGIGYGGSIQVQRPGDGKVIFTKTYNQSTTRDSFTVETPYFGEYKVHIKANNGYTYDIAYIKVHLSRTASTTYTYTARDVLNWKIGASINIAAFLALGYVSFVAVSATATILSVGSSLGSIWVHDTKYEPFPIPKAGDKITTKLEPVADGVKTTWSYKAKNGAVYPDKVVIAKYLSYPR